MGGGDLNLKKSWHPSTLKNQERVWKAEQQKAQEDSRVRELQRELREERDREHLTNVAEASGAVVSKSSDTKLNWMYKGPTDHVNREEYLLGRKIDKTFHLMEEAERQDKGEEPPPTKSTYVIEHEIVPSSVVSENASGLQVDMRRKFAEDPLLAIRQQEEATRRHITSNPVKMKQLHLLIDSIKGKKKRKDSSSTDSSDSSDSTEKEKKKKKKKKEKKKNKKQKKSKSSKKHKTKVSKKSSKKKKKKKSKYSSSDDSSSSDESEADTEMKISSKKNIQDKSLQLSKQSQEDENTGQIDDKFRRRDNRSPDHSNQRSPRQNRRQQYSPIERSRRSRSRSDIREHHGHHEKSRRRSRSQSPRDYRSHRRESSPPRNNSSKFKRNKLSEEEMDRKRNEMMKAAQDRDVERLDNIKKYDRERKRELEEEMNSDTFRRRHIESANSGSIECSIKSQVSRMQRGRDHMETNFLRK